MTFPENCLRGIPNSSFLDADGSVGSHLFYFRPEDVRDDGWTEQSVNWEDDLQAIEFTLNQEKEEGGKQFKAGVVILPRREIDRLNRQPTVNGVLSYERQQLDDNPYHGNLLLKTEVCKRVMKKIAAGLALHVSTIILQEED